MHRALGFIFLLASAISPSFAADPDDYHVTQDPSRRLYLASAFAHGYRHGYEEGFHNADRDLHLSLFALQQGRIEKVPKTVGYQSKYGAKDSFRKGFENGYRAGYSDSAANRAFRLMPMPLIELASPDKDFDRGVQVGFQDMALDCKSGFSQAFCSGLRVGKAMALAHADRTQVAAAADAQKH